METSRGVKVSAIMSPGVLRSVNTVIFLPSRQCFIGWGWCLPALGPDVGIQDDIHWQEKSSLSRLQELISHPLSSGTV